MIRVFDFYKKHAIGSLAAPSCLCCGRSTQDVEVAIKHMELPDIVVCAECHRAIAQPVEQTRALTDEQRAKMIADLEAEQTFISSSRERCDPNYELPRWDRLQAIIDHLAGGA